MPEPSSMGSVPSVPTAAHSATAGQVDEERRRLRQACREMEAYFLNMLLEKMHGGDASQGLFGKSPQARMFRGMFHEAMSRQMAERDALGIGAMLYQQLSKSLETSETAPAGEEIP